VTDPSPLLRRWAATASRSNLLSFQLAWAADQLQQRATMIGGGRGMELITWEDGSSSRYPSNLNAGTAALHTFYRWMQPKGPVGDVGGATARTALSLPTGACSAIRPNTPSSAQSR